MKYQEKTTLDQRGAIDQDTPIAVDGSLLIGDEWVARFNEGHTHYGYDETKIYPAFHKGERAWVTISIWESSPGYSCSGITNETILGFEQGIELLMQKGAFEHLFEV